MAHVRNLDMWLEIWDRPIFNNEDGSHYRQAWDATEALSRSGKLSTLDLLNLQALIDACLRWQPED